jgi:hypothetical protein
MSNLGNALESGNTITRCPNHAKIWEIRFPALYRAYTSTSRLSLDFAPAVNDIVSIGDESNTTTVTT